MSPTEDVDASRGAGSFVPGREALAPDQVDGPQAASLPPISLAYIPDAEGGEVLASPPRVLRGCRSVVISVGQHGADAMSAKEKNKTADAELRTNEKKWSKTLMDAGWTVFPSVIIENQRQLGLSAMGVNILMHLASRWWTAEGRPYPSKASIALAMSVDPRTIQRRIAAMEKAGYVRREERRETPTGSKTNVYHLDGLIEAAKPFAEEKLAEIAERVAVSKIRASRRGAPKPKLQLVKSEGD